MANLDRCFYTLIRVSSNQSSCVQIAREKLVVFEGLCLNRRAAPRSFVSKPQSITAFVCQFQFTSCQLLAQLTMRVFETRSRGPVSNFGAELLLLLMLHFVSTRITTTTTPATATTRTTATKRTTTTRRSTEDYAETTKEPPRHHQTHQNTARGPAGHY